MRATCVICSDLLDSESTNIATPCGHVFHQICVLQWLEYKSSCPACRHNMNKNKLIKLYLNVSVEENEEKCSNQLENELSNTRSILREKDMEIKKLQDRASELKCFVVKAEGEREEYHKKCMDSYGEVTALKMQLKQLMKESSATKKLISENRRLENQLQLLRSVEAIINGNKSDIDEILNTYGDGQQSYTHMATYISMIKRQLQSCREEKCLLQQETRDNRKKIGLLNSQIHEKKLQIENLKQENKHLNESIEKIEETNREKGPQPGKRTMLLSTPKHLDFSFQENIPTPTPCKRPRINMVNAFVTKIKSQNDKVDDPLVQLGKNIFSDNPEANLENSQSTIRQGYNGLGGHSKHIFRSAPVKLKLSKKT